MEEHDALDPEQNPAPKIKVTDRRKFDAEGNRRAQDEADVPPESASPAAEPEAIGADDDAEDRASVDEPGGGVSAAGATTSAAGTGTVPGGQPGPEPTSAPGPGDSPQPPGPVDLGADDESASRAAPGPEGPDEHPSPDDLPRDFSAFVEGQYFEALLYLGAMRHPQTGEVVEDLGMAKYKIDILSMLQEKTEGNLSAEESKLIEDVVYQLRMAFLQKQKVAKL